MRKLLIPTACLGVFVISQPALAQDLHVESVRSFDRAPAGATVAVGIAVPLGGSRDRASEPTYGFTVSYGRRFDNPRPFEPVRTRAIELAQFNLDTRGPREVQLANFNVEDFGREDSLGPRFDLNGGNTPLILIGSVVAGLAILEITEAIDIFDSGDEDSESDSDTGSEST